MKILITGVAGFIGSHLADSLIEKGHEVIGIDNLSAGQKRWVNKKAKFHKLDIRSKRIIPLFEGVDIVYHLAAQSEIPYCQEHIAEICDINIMGFVNVLEASRQVGVKKVIYAESAAIYEGAKIFPSPETEFAPTKFYGASKACNNIIAKAYQHSVGMITVGLRFFGVYGPRQDYRREKPALMSALMLRILSGRKPMIRVNSENKFRDFIYISDIVRFLTQCIDDNKVNNEVFNLGSGESYSVVEVCRKVCELLGLPFEYDLEPELAGEPREVLADFTKAKSLGWIPEVSLSDGLKKMWEYMKINT